MLVAVLLVGAIYLRMWDPHVDARTLVWRQAAQMIGQRPVLGWGGNALDHRVFFLTPRTELRWNFLFNEWLQAWLEFGVLAPALALGYAVALARRLRHRVAVAGECLPAAAFVLLTSGFSIPFHIGPVALLAALMLGTLDRRLV